MTHTSDKGMHNGTFDKHMTSRHQITFNLSYAKGKSMVMIIFWLLNYEDSYKTAN